MSFWIEGPRFPKVGVTMGNPIFIGFSTINHSFWGAHIYGNLYAKFCIEASRLCHRYKITSHHKLWVMLHVSQVFTIYY
jgi:hypothetical protein